MTIWSTLAVCHWTLPCLVDLPFRKGEVSSSPSNCEWLSLQKGNQQEPNHPEYACLSRRNIMTCLILDSSWNFRMMWILWTCWFHGFYLRMYFAECIHNEFHLWKLTYFWQITILSWQVKGLLHGHLCYSYVTNCQRVNHPGLITMEISCRVQALYWFKLVIIQYMGLCHFMLFHWITHSYNILQPNKTGKTIPAIPAFGSLWIIY